MQRLTWQLMKHCFYGIAKIRSHLFYDFTVGASRVYLSAIFKMSKNQCQLVRRLTGGSAVLHDDELTYSMIVSEKHPKIPTTVNDAYYELAQGILNGYKELGIDAEFAIPKSHLRKERTAVCFEKPAIYELVVNGKKISGNAQTRKHGVLLQ